MTHDNLGCPGIKYMALLPCPYLRGVHLKKLGGGVRPAFKTLTLFMTKICDIPYPVYDLTKYSIRHLWSVPLIKTLFQTCATISSLVQISVK